MAGAIAMSGIDDVPAALQADLLDQARFRHLKLALLLCVLALAARCWQGLAGGAWPTWLLGAVSALLVAAMFLLGWRKRRGARHGDTLRGWLSAHIYLGLALLVIATLHSGLHLGWNVHTLCYTLMLLVVGSGIYGSVVYIGHPQLIAANGNQGSPAAWLAELDEIDALSLQLASTLGGEVRRAVTRFIERVPVGGGLREQLFGSHLSPHPAFAQLREELDQAARPQSRRPDDESHHKLLGLLQRRLELGARLNRDIRLHAQMHVWLYLHLPLSFALLAALLAHVLSVFIYR